MPRHEDNTSRSDDGPPQRSRAHHFRRDGRRSRSTDTHSGPRYSRRHSSYHPQSTSDDNEHLRGGGFAKVALGVVFVEIVATCVSLWMKKKQEESDRHRREDTRRQFDKAKARRRREEERWERQQDELERREREEWDVDEVREVRRIGYLPAEPATRSNSRASQPPLDWEENDGSSGEEGQQRGEKRRRHHRR